MASDVIMTARGVDASALDTLSRLIEKRAKYLNGETTRAAVTATAINVLSSLRARTRATNVNKADFGTFIAPAPGVVAGWKSDSKGASKQNARRVVRTIGGHEMQNSLVVNLAGQFKPGESPLCFVVISKFKRTVGSSEKYDRVYVIAKNANDVRKWANARQKKYVRRFAGMAKWAIGQAQRQISAANFSDVNPSAEAKATALQHLAVRTAEGGGMSSGSYSVEVEDALGYSMAALKNGAADFDLAVKKAANRTAKIISRLAGYRLDEDIPTPFPEVKGRK